MLLAAHLAAQAHTHGGLGPGPGPWAHEPAELHSLSSAALDEAAERLSRELPHRYCFLVAKDGAVVHESYSANSSETLYSMDSAMKLGTAALIGIAHADGMLDLDAPLAEYGLEPTADWGPYWPLVTTRHLLSMVSGLGQKPPGTAFAYDSGSHLQELIWLLEHVTREASVHWATRRLAIPLGVPNMFAGQTESAHVHAGGDNRLPCSAMLRLGQLFVNGGWWADRDGAPVRLLSAAYVREVFTPQYPETNSAYGFLTWLNQHPSRPADSYKRPGLGWCDIRVHGAWCDAGGSPVDAPPSLALGMGWLAKYVLLLPETRTVVVSIGQSWTRSAACQPPQNVWNYDEAFGSRTLWRSVGSALLPPPRASPAAPASKLSPLLARLGLLGNYSLPRPTYGREAAALVAWESLRQEQENDLWFRARLAAWELLPRKISEFVQMVDTSAEVVRESAVTTYDQHGKPAILPTLSPAWPGPPPPGQRADEPAADDVVAEVGLAASKAADGVAGAADWLFTLGGSGGPLGSCYCACPIDLGFGQCFDARSEGECAALEPLGREHCPAIGVVNQCAQRWPDCSFMPIILSWKLLQGNPLQCETRKPCPQAPTLTHFGGEPHFRQSEDVTEDTTGSCDCYAERFVRCTWDERPRCGMLPGNGESHTAVLAGAAAALEKSTALLQLQELPTAQQRAAGRAYLRGAPAASATPAGWRWWRAATGYGGGAAAAAAAAALGLAVRGRRRRGRRGATTAPLV